MEEFGTVLVVRDKEECINNKLKGSFRNKSQ